MQVKAEHPSNILVKLHVTLEPEEIRQAYNFALNKVKAKAKLPGFRDGKVPTALLRRRFGDLIEAEGVEQIFQTHVPMAVQESQVHPVATPRVKEATERLAPGEDFSFVLECDVLPKLEKLDYDGIDIPAIVAEISEEDLNSEIAQIQARHADAVPVTDEAVETGNKVAFSYFGNAGTTEIPEDQPITNEIEMGTERLVPGLHDALLGMHLGESKEVEFTYPDDFPTEELRGSEAKLHVTVTGIHELIYPDIDDELAKSVGLETLDELRARIREGMVQNLDEQNREKRHTQLFDLLLEKNPFEVPEQMVQDTLGTMQRLYHQSLLGQGFAPDAAARMIQETSDDASPMTERQIKIDHLLRTLREMEEITVEEEDLDVAYQRESIHTGMPLPRIKARYNSEDAKTRLESRVMREKVIAFLLGEEISAPEPEIEPGSATEHKERPIAPEPQGDAPSEAKMEVTPGAESDTPEADETPDEEADAEEQNHA